MKTTTHTFRAACRRCRRPTISIYGPPLRRPLAARYSTGPGDDLNNPTPKRPHSKLIILEPPRKQRPPEHASYPPPEIISTMEFEPLEQAKTLLTYEAEAERDMARVNISLLRPSQLQVSEQRFNQLAEQLSKSFTVHQLRSYYDFSRSEMAMDGQHIPRVSSSISKVKLVPFILSRVWKVEKTEDIAERQDVLVNKDLECSTRDIFFLVGEDGQTLREWANRYGAKITVNIQESSLQIQASQVSIEAIEAQMAILFQEVKEEEIDVSSIVRVGSFEWKLVPAISRTTSTFIERLEGDRVLLSALKQESIDNARRLLFTSVPLSIRTESSLLYEPPTSDSVKGGLFPVTEAVALPWIYRRQDWSRWRYITPANAPASDSESRLLSLSPTDVSSVLESQHPELEPPPGDLGRLRSRIVHEAVFGHVLHHYDSSERLVARGLREFVEQTKSSRAFCQTFPGSPFFSKFVEALPGPSVEFTHNEGFQLSFLPSPWEHPEDFEKYPPVHIFMPINETSDSSKGRPVLRALQSKSIADVMLPGEHCDIRFARTREVQMGIVSNIETEFGVQIREWQRFLLESNLDPVVDHRLRAASKLQVHIPSWLIEPGSRYESGAVNYTFAGMQYRRSTQATVGAIKYTKTEVDGGATGGRTTELKLSRTGSGKPDMLEQEFATLFARALYGVTALREWMSK
ncbi:hypothetical protein EX30DRAFT_342583 [Ascodesmis nigricans]|uniref:K Homology domain-containing protein n=1 Tax=Ascodesmis nigricans TaxID=341454 RepID=A0A4V3SI86_9PEZI|nr:hypothetical protein EX30DRAFT_342583 [Ascodesmis nigricans]